MITNETKKPTLNELSDIFFNNRINLEFGPDGSPWSKHPLTCGKRVTEKELRGAVKLASGFMDGTRSIDESDQLYATAEHFLARYITAAWDP